MPHPKVGEHGGLILGDGVARSSENVGASKVGSDILVEFTDAQELIGMNELQGRPSDKLAGLPPCTAFE